LILYLQGLSHRGRPCSFLEIAIKTNQVQLGRSQEISIKTNQVQLGRSQEITIKTNQVQLGAATYIDGDSIHLSTLDRRRSPSKQTRCSSPLYYHCSAILPKQPGAA
jgi:hypothetical protein